MTDTLVHEGPGPVATVRSAATGDAVAFARLVEAHHASMARVAYVISGDVDSANDAVQTAWAIAWQKLRTLRDPSQVRPWLIAAQASTGVGSRWAARTAACPK
jgi:RNA polymerase sigma-70 factor (ECF subfamily)